MQIVDYQYIVVPGYRRLMYNIFLLSWIKLIFAQRKMNGAGTLGTADLKTNNRE